MSILPTATTFTSAICSFFIFCSFSEWNHMKDLECRLKGAFLHNNFFWVLLIGDMKLNREEGKVEGKAEGKIQMLKELVKDGTLSVVKAAAKAEMTVEQFEKELDKEVHKIKWGFWKVNTDKKTVHQAMLF